MAGANDNVAGGGLAAARINLLLAFSKIQKGTDSQEEARETMRHFCRPMLLQEDVAASELAHDGLAMLGEAWEQKVNSMKDIGDEILKVYQTVSAEEGVTVPVWTAMAAGIADLSADVVRAEIEAAEADARSKPTTTEQPAPAADFSVPLRAFNPDDPNAKYYDVESIHTLNMPSVVAGYRPPVGPNSTIPKPIWQQDADYAAGQFKKTKAPASKKSKASASKKSPSFRKTRSGPIDKDDRADAQASPNVQGDIVAGSGAEGSGQDDSLFVQDEDTTAREDVDMDMGGVDDEPGAKSVASGNGAQSMSVMDAFLKS